ncbi:MAG: hypothetical protein FIO02_11875, partial [Nitrosopumilales archaeon]|nr:hypothetical protein [Nitrosopumilales archaeon]
VKFTEEGTILVNVQKPLQEDLIVSVKDAGTGIDLGIFPGLFEKFASKSLCEKSTSSIGDPCTCKM